MVRNGCNLKGLLKMEMNAFPRYFVKSFFASHLLSPEHDTKLDPRTKETPMKSLKNHLIVT